MSNDDRLRQLIDHQAPTLRDLLLVSLAGLSVGGIEALTVALESGNLHEAIRLAVGPIDDIRGPLRQQLLQVVTGGAEITTAHFGLSFGLTDPNAVRVAETLAAAAVTGIEEETRRAIRTVIARGLREGVPLRDLAAEILRLVGLSERDAVAADTYWLRMREDGVPDGQAADRVQEYVDRLLERRAETIARTEIITASTHGKRLGWQQAADNGYLDPATTRIVWIVTPDDRLCPECAPMAGVTVGFYDSFTATQRATGDLGRTAGGTAPYVGGTEALKQHITVKGPTLHPNCRCDLGLAFAATDDGLPTSLDDWPAGCNPPGLLAKEEEGREQCAFTAEQWEALDPERFDTKGEANKGYDEVLAELEATPDGKRLAEFIEKWTSAPSMASFRNAVARVLSGETADTPTLQRAEAFIRALRQSSYAPDELFRGGSIRGSLENVMARFVEGSTVDWNISSWTTDWDVAAGFAALSQPGSGHTMITYVMRGPQQAFPVMNLSRSSFYKEQEWIAGGRYRVDRVRASGPRSIQVDITQVEGL